MFQKVGIGLVRRGEGDELHSRAALGAEERAADCVTDPLEGLSDESNLTHGYHARTMGWMSSTEIIQIQVTPGLRRQLEAETAKLNLSLSEYIQYLHARLSMGHDSAWLEIRRHAL